MTTKRWRGIKKFKIPLEGWEFGYAFGMKAVCPDCHRTVMIPADMLEEYKFCPFCGKKRIADDPAN